nr:hypothetical protein [Escherichia coli]
MHKSEAEKIDSILDEHQQIYRRHNQINNILAYCACIAWIPCIIAAFGVDGIYLKILFAVLACCGAVCFFIFFFTLLPESLMVLSRQSLLQLMRLTEDVPDVRQELLNRLLSGKKLTGRDEQDIRRLCPFPPEAAPRRRLPAWPAHFRFPYDPRHPSAPPAHCYATPGQAA